MYEEILLNVYTSSDAHILISEIRKLKESLYKQTPGAVDVFDSVLSSEVRSWVAQVIREETKKGGREGYLTGLENAVAKMREMSVTLGFETNELTLKKIVDSIKKTFGVDIYVNFLYDRKLIGGIVIAFEGKYIDYSLKRVYERVFEAEKEKVKTIILK